MTELPRKELIEVALPLDAINKASAREKSIRHGHPLRRMSSAPSPRTAAPWNFTTHGFEQE